MRTVDRRSAPLGLLALGLVLAVVSAPPAGAVGEPGQDAELPVAGTFSYSLGGDDTRPVVRGAVHAVRRVPGGTAVYYSVGVPRGERWTATASMPVSSLQEDYRFGDAAAIALIDPVGLRYYQPMVGPSGCLCPRVAELGRDSGVLHVGWAVVPALPAAVRTVSVAFGFGNQVEDVPVEDGALEPAVDQPSTQLGQGWPRLPPTAGVGDPARYVRDLVRNVTDVDGAVSTAERPGRVDETLAADVLFAVDSAALSPQAASTLDELAARLRERAVGEVTVTGHTDSSGTDAYNVQLSTSRAQTVLTALRASAPTSPLKAVGRGEQDPVADNGTDAGRAKNRRVTVTYSVAGS